MDYPVLVNPCKPSLSRNAGKKAGQGNRREVNCHPSRLIAGVFVSKRDQRGTENLVQVSDICSHSVPRQSSDTSPAGTRSNIRR